MDKVKSISATILFLSFIAPSIAQNKNQDYSALVKAANTYYKKRDYKNSLKAFQSAFRFKRENALDLYNAACNAALFGKKNMALEYLELSLSLGWSDSDHLEKDQDLYNLHPLPQWKNIVAKAQQNSKELSVTALISKVEGLIESRKTIDLLNMFKADSIIVEKSGLKQRIEFIHDFLAKNKITRLDNLTSSSNSSNTYSAEHGTVLKESYQKVYNLIPSFFGKNTAQLFSFPLGFEVQLIVEKVNGKWQPQNIEVVNKMFASDYALKSDIKDFTNNTDSARFRFFILQGTKQIAGTGSIRLSDLAFLKTDPKLVYMSLADISDENPSDSYMSLVLVKNDPGSDLPFAVSGFFKSKPKINKLEFIFSRSEAKVCLISNGLGYGFYQTDLASEIEKFVVTNLNKIKD